MITRLAVITLLAVASILPCSVDYAIWSQRGSDADPLYRFVRGGKAGYIDSQGRVVIPPKFSVYGNYSGVFHSGLVETSISDGIYADPTGEIVIPHKFYRGWDFSEGLAAAMPKDTQLWGFIDTKGEWAISPRFKSSPRDYVWPFSDGLAAIEVSGLLGYIDRAGEFVIKPRFLHGNAFQDGMARVVVDGPCMFASEGPCGSIELLPKGAVAASPPSCKVTFVNRSGEVLPLRFDGAGDFSEGLAPVTVVTRAGFIDKTGRFVVPPRFDSARPFSDGLAAVLQDGKWGFIDKTGLFVIPPKYRFESRFSDGIAAVPIDGGYIFIDKSGAQVISEKFAIAGDFYHGLAHVKFEHGREFAYIDRTGKHVFTYTP